ncbi:MAG: PH domain-containing protein [Spirochaetales bacterium]
MKYERVENNYYREPEAIKLNKIEDILLKNETILWRGKPKKNAYILNKIFTMLPFALIWLAFDSIFIWAAITDPGMPFVARIGILAFIALHLLPFWLWLANVLTAKKRYEHIEYVVTDRRILIRSGFIGIDFQSINFKDISNVNLRVGLFDRLFKVGDIYFYTNNPKTSSQNVGNRESSDVFFDIENPYEIYSKIQKIVLDIQTDIEYPNALRPESNPGYNTQYKG